MFKKRVEKTPEVEKERKFCVHSQTNLQLKPNLSKIWDSHGGEYEDGCLLPPSSGRPDGGSSTDRWHVGKLIPVYTALQPTRQPSSKPNLIKQITPLAGK
jgi:hypothetical protein